MITAKKRQSKAKTDEPSRKQPAPKPQPQPGFGEFVRQSRVKAGYATQAAFAKTLGRPQSYIAQLETDKITHLDYQEKCDLAKALEGAGVDFFKICAAWAKDKDRVPAAKADLLTRDVLDLDGLAEWEIAIKPQALWIAAPNFIDNEHDKMLHAVVRNLRASAEITYFVAKADCHAFGRFTMLKRKLRVELGPTEWEKVKLNHYELEDNELCWLASSFVIANPQDKETDGYIILNQDTEQGPVLGESQLSVPAIGFKLSTKELQLRAVGIETYIKKKKEEAEKKREEEAAAKGPERRVESIEGRKVTG